MRADHFMGGQLTYETIDLDTLRGIFQVTLKLERSCGSISTFNPEYNIKVLEYDSKRNPAYALNVYSAKLFDSSYIYFPCTPNTTACASSAGQIIEVKYYRAQIVVQNSKKECVVYFDDYSNRSSSNNLANSEDRMILYTSFIPGYINSQISMNESKRHFPLKDKLCTVNYDISDVEGDSFSFKTSLPFKSLSYSFNGSNLNYSLLKCQANAGLHDNKTFYMHEANFTTSPSSIQFTPSAVQNSWLSMVKSEFRKINLGVKDTWICISKSNVDRLFAMFHINSQFHLQNISSDHSSVKINSSQITICNNGHQNTIKFDFPIESMIQANKFKIHLAQSEVSSLFTSSRKTGIGGIDTLSLTFNYLHSGFEDLASNLRFDFELCHTSSGIGFDRSFSVPFHIFNYKIFQHDTILSCSSNLTIQTLLQKSLTTSWGTYTQSKKSINITNPKDTWIIAQLTAPNLNCPSKDSIYINQGSIFTINTTGYSPSCKGYLDASAKVRVIGTNGPFSYRWSNSSTLDSIASIPAGRHIVIVSDKDNCQQTDSLNIPEPQGIDAHWVTDSHITCYGGSNGKGHIQVTSSLKPSQYNWTTLIAVDSFLNNLSAGNYLGSYRYTNLANKVCDQAYSFTITQPDSIYLHIVKTDNSCFGETKGKIAVLPIGGYGDFLFYFDHLEYTVGFKDNLANGTFNIYVKDAKNCQSSSQPIIITSPSRLKYNIVANNPSCAQVSNGLLLINHPDGGVVPYTFSYNQGPFGYENIFPNLGVGAHTIKMRDANDCIFSQNFSLFPSYTLLAKPDILEDSKCPLSNTGRIHLDILNGASPYKIYHNSDSSEIATLKFQLDGLKKGAHAIKIIDNNKCSWLSQYQINEPDTIKLNSIVNHESCFGKNDGRIVAEIINGGTLPYSSLSWYNANNALLANAQSLSPGNYFLRFKDNRNCLYEYRFPILGKLELKANLTISNPINCYGYNSGKVKSQTTGGNPPYQFNWKNLLTTNTDEAANLPAGNYVLEIKDADNCMITDSIQLLQPKPIRLESLKIKDADCPNIPNGAIAIQCLDNNGSNTLLKYKLKNKTEYSLSNNMGSLAQGIYTIVVQDSIGCEKEFLGEVKIDKSLEVQMPTLQSFELGEERILYPSLIFGEGTTLSDITGFDWNPKHSLSCTDCQSPKYTASKSETYSIEVNYGKICKASASGYFEVSKPEDLFIPNSFSPNGDDKNDIWLVYGKNIIGYEVFVFNRVGEAIYTSKDILKGWDGNYKGKKEATNTYKYQIKATYADRSERFYEGSLYLFR
jgi:gliding motility-associated-like protein